MSLLPHRYPFLLVDRVLELVPRQAGGGDQEREHQRALLSRALAGDADHARRARRRGPGAGRRRADRREHPPRTGKLALIAAIDGIKLRRPIVPGDQVLLEVVGNRIKDHSAVVTGTARVGGGVAAEARFRFVIIEARRAAVGGSARRKRPGQTGTDAAPPAGRRIGPAEGPAVPRVLDLTPTERNPAIMATLIADTACVDPRAEIDDDVEVGPYCVSGPRSRSAGAPA